MSNITMQPLTVGVKDLMTMLGVGKAKAYTIGREAGAEIRLGRRCVYNVKKVEEYLESLRR